MVYLRKDVYYASLALQLLTQHHIRHGFSVELGFLQTLKPENQRKPEAKSRSEKKRKSEARRSLNNKTHLLNRQRCRCRC